MSVRLFVGNLPYDATEDELRTHFSTVGSLSNVFIPLDRETGKKRGFAFVEFSDAAQAQEAIRQFNNQPFKGRTLAVNEARAKESRPASTGGGYRPAPPMRPSAPNMRVPAPDFGSEPAGDDGSIRTERARKFGPDAKPSRSRSPRFKPEGTKRSFKEKLGGQIFAPDDEEEFAEEPEIDNFAMGLDTLKDE